ncbi:MAG: nucleotidyl transferase AbiEii/AbiGii toxin family protein [Bacteroidota bacterium]
MLKDYYNKNLYPLQDRILALIDSAKTGFYLTGGTALSRFYLHHRYSDDLDFFQNMSPTFDNDLSEIINVLLKEQEFEFEVLIKSEKYFRSQLHYEDISIKMEFINDVPYHFGELKTFELFSKVDNIYNILSNKITAIIDRDEPKDFVDILYIWKNYSPDWKEIFKSATSKAAGIFPPIVAEKILNFNLDYLDNIKWIKTPEMEIIKYDREKIGKDIIGVS